MGYLVPHGNLNVVILASPFPLIAGKFTEPVKDLCTRGALTYMVEGHTIVFFFA